jgi:hypothetical protein
LLGFRDGGWLGFDPRRVLRIIGEVASAAAIAVISRRNPELKPVATVIAAVCITSAVYEVVA